MSRHKAPLPLVEKIAQAFEAVGKVPRAGTNKARRYKYPRASDVFEAVRGELFKRRVLICPTEATPEYKQLGESNGGEQITECRLQVTYTVRDALEKLEPMVVHGIGRDVEDKALYKAQTGAQKALLKRLGLLAEEVDDPEFDSEATDAAAETLDDIAPMRPKREPKKTTPAQIRAFQEACDQHGKTPEEQIAYLEKFHQVREVTSLGRGRPFTEALQWASGEGGDATVPKLQAVPAQTNLPLRTAPGPIEMKIGNQKISFAPKDKAYSV